MKKKDTAKYKLSFTTGSQYRAESVKIAELYREVGDWEQTREIALEENLLQARTQSSGIRLTRELCQRLQTLMQEQLALLIYGSLDDQQKLLWLGICKLYQFIREFATEVIHEKFLVMDYQLTDLDYDAFFNRRADWHPELEEITDTTEAKLKQVVFRILRESGITDDNDVILPTLLSSRMIEVLMPDAPMSFRIFPVNLNDIEVTIADDEPG